MRAMQHCAALAVILSKLDDVNNARRAYERALTIDANDPSVALNFAIFEWRQNDSNKAKQLMQTYTDRLVAATWTIDQVGS